MSQAHIPARRQRKTQQGLGLVEILIGLAIGLLVVAAALGTLASVRSSATASNESTRMQELADSTFRVLGHHLRQSGSIRLIRPTESPTGTVRFAGFVDSQGAPLQALNAVNGAAGASDTLTIAYHGDDTMLSSDCNGGLPAPPADAGAAFAAPIVNIFSVQGNELVCQSWPQVGAFGLVQGVEDFELMFLERSGSDSRYLAVPNDWASVVAVSVCVQFVSASGGFVNHGYLDCQGNPAVSVDGQLRRSFTRVFQMRNS